MEEKDQSGRDAGDESERALLPLLEPPADLHRITNFYIENILRPDFGRGKDAQSRSLHRAARAELSPSPAGSPGSGQRACSPPAGASNPGADPCANDSDGGSGAAAPPSGKAAMMWPAWVYCTRYSDRPSSGPRSRRPKKKPVSREDKRPRTAFTAEQLQRLKAEFQSNRYLTEQRRQGLATELQLNEAQIKIWFQNKRAKIKKATGNKNSLAVHLMAQGLYNHATTSKEDKSDSE